MKLSLDCRRHFLDQENNWIHIYLLIFCFNLKIESGSLYILIKKMLPLNDTGR